MFKDGVSEKQIAKFYHTEKSKIEKDYASKRSAFKKIKESAEVNSTK